MKYATGNELINGYRREIADIRQKMRKAQSEVEPQDVADYTFTSPTGPCACRRCSESMRI